MNHIFGHFHELEFDKQDLPENYQVDVLMKVIENYNNLTKGSATTELQVLLMQLFVTFAVVFRIFNSTMSVTSQGRSCFRLFRTCNDE